MTGYTALVERHDPEVVRNVMAQVKTEAVHVVEAHGGIVNQFVGDEVVALFGIPKAREDDPLRAVRAALAMRARARNVAPLFERDLGIPFGVHIGIETGLIVSEFRDSRDGAYSLTGDSVNIAARLLALAGKDEILIGPTTHGLIAPFIRTNSLEAITPKGKSVPVVPYRLLDLSWGQHRFKVAQKRGLTPHVGREAELGRLQNLLDQVLAGQGQFVRVVGDRGIGKSRLLHEFRTRVRDRGVGVITAQCVPHGAATPYHPFLDGLRRGLRLGDERSPERLRDKLIRHVQMLSPELQSQIPYLLQLFSRVDEPLPPSASREELRVRFEEALRQVITASLRIRPLVLIGEDWQWADDASNAALRNLINAMAGQPLMLVISHRPGQGATGANREQHTRISLSALEPQGTGEIVRAILGAREVDEELLHRIHLQAGGNPFFVEELCIALKEEDRVTIIDDRARPAVDLASLHLPASVQSVVHTRIDALEPQARDLLRIAAVIGPVFTQDLLGQVAGESHSLQRVLRDLQYNEFIELTSLSAKPSFRFKHQSTQQVAYDALLRHRRQTLHRQVGDAMEIVYASQLEEHLEALAHHFSRGHDRSKALHYLARAGAKAEQYFALAEAREHYRTAVRLLERGGVDGTQRRRRIEFCLQWGAVSFYSPSQELLEALERARNDAQELGDKALTARTTLACGKIRYALGQYALARNELQHALTLPAVLDEADLRAQATTYAGRVQFFLCDFEDARCKLEASIPALAMGPTPEEAVNSRAILALVLAFMGQFEASAAVDEAIQTISKQLGNPTAVALGLFCAGVRCIQESRWEPALDCLRRARNPSRRSVNPLLHAMVIWGEGYARAMSGDSAQGLRSMREGIGLIETTGSQFALCACYGYLADAYVYLGDMAPVAELARRSMDLAASGGDQLGDSTARMALALALTDRTPPAWEQAEEMLSGSLSLAEDTGMQPVVARGLFRQAQLLERHGDVAGAREALRDAQEQFQALHMPGYIEQAEGFARGLTEP